MPRIPSGRSGKRRWSKREQIQFIVRECDKQAEQWKVLARKLGALSGQVLEHGLWLYKNTEMWESVASACNQDEFSSLASKLGLNVENDTPRDIFLIGASTLETYEIAWNIVIGSSTGYAHKRLKEIYRIEREINMQIYKMVMSANVYLRGTTIKEAIEVFKSIAHSSYYHTFVSMTVATHIALQFGANYDNRLESQQVVMVLDASRVREFGAQAAQYSIASQALYMGQLEARRLGQPGAQQLGLPEESVKRMFRFGLAFEAQAHLDDRWPPEASDALLAISTVGEPDKYVREAIDSIGILSIPLGSV